MSHLTASGNLVITANNAWRHALAELLREDPSGIDAQAEFFREMSMTREGLFVEEVLPEQIGALTGAPILAEVFERDEDTNEPTSIGRVWWYPNYCFRDPMRVLANTGRVVFQSGS